MSAIGIRIKKLHPDFRVPEYKTEGAAGFDLVALSYHCFNSGQRYRIPLGFAIDVPPGYCLEIRPRSGNSLKGLDVHLGTIDSDYRGEVAAIVSYSTDDGYFYEINAGERIAQGVIVPILRARLLEAEELSETVRGAGGFGSTGR